MTSRFIFTEEAERQLLEILEYVADENESAAVRVRHAIHDAVEKLADTPGIGHTREDGPASEILERLFVSRGLRP